MSKGKVIMNIPDLHISYHHKDAFMFLEAVKKKYKPNIVVCLGDEVDNHSMSFHDSDPDLPSAGDELKEAVSYLKVLYKIFPKAIVLNSNHGSMHYRKGKHHGIPRKYLKSYNEILEAPKTWKWVNDLTLDMGNGQKCFFTHGMEKNTGRFARNMGMCVVQGHYHTDFNIEYSSSPEQLIWGMSSGCLIDKKSMAFAYDKSNIKRPILGCSVIINGIPRLIPMILKKDGRWNGKV